MTTLSSGIGGSGRLRAYDIIPAPA
jgi:hypothetical protein